MYVSDTLLRYDIRGCGDCDGVIRLLLSGESLSFFNTSCAREGLPSAEKKHPIAMCSGSGSSRVTVLFFAQVREVTQETEGIVLLDDDGDVLQSGISMDAFVCLLEKTWPRLKEIRGHYLLAVNREYVARDDVRIRGGDEVALIPPVSGG